MGSAAVGNMLKKTLGVKVNHIYHSMVSTLLDPVSYTHLTLPTKA